MMAVQGTSATRVLRNGGRKAANTSRRYSEFSKFGGYRENRFSEKVPRRKGISPRRRLEHARRVRLYDPNSGRFLQKDPSPGQLNIPATVVNSYIYGINNPLLYNDPTGKSIFGDILSGLAIVGAVAVFGPGALVAIGIAGGLSAGLTGALTGNWSFGNLASGFLAGAGGAAAVMLGGYAGGYAFGGLGVGGAFAGGALGGAAASIGMAALNGASGAGLAIAGLAGAIGGTLTAGSGYNAYLESTGAEGDLAPEVPSWAPNNQPGSIPIPGTQSAPTPGPGGSGNGSCPYSECIIFPTGMSL